MNRKIVSLLFILGLATSLSTSVPARTTAQVPEILVIAQSADILTGDPHKTAGISTHTVLWNIYEMLTARDAELRLKPGLALSWQAIEPTTWEFKLRRGVRFHNGEPFNAQAVKLSFDRVLDPKTKSPVAGRLRSIKSVTVVDDYTVRMTTERPWPLLPATISRHGWIVPPRYLQQNGEEALVRRPVGTGPYKFVQWAKDDRVELEANANYWGGQPKIGRVIIRAIPSESSRLAELLAGSVHLINLVPPEVFGPIERSSRAKLVHGRSASIFFIQLNLLDIPRDRPLADKRVRQAMNYTVDRKALIDAIMQNAVNPVATFCTEVHLGCDMSIPPFPNDPARARALLREAGYLDGFDMTISTTNGVYPGDRDITLAIADQLAGVGIRARVVIKEFGIYLRELLEKKVPDDAFFVRNTAHVGYAGEVAIEAFRSGGLVSFWSNREFDQLLDAAGITLDEARAKDLLRRSQLLYKDEAPAITLFTAPNAYGLHRDLEWTPRPDLMLMMFDASWKRR